MIVDCILKTYYKKKGDNPDRFNKVPSYEMRHYSNKADFDSKYELCIVSISEDDNEIEVLKRVEIYPEGDKQFNIRFHTIGYTYFSSGGYIYCSTTRHKI